MRRVLKVLGVALRVKRLRRLIRGGDQTYDTVNGEAEPHRLSNPTQYTPHN